MQLLPKRLPPGTPLNYRAINDGMPVLTPSLRATHPFFCFRRIFIRVWGDQPAPCFGHVRSDQCNSSIHVLLLPGQARSSPQHPFNLAFSSAKPGAMSALGPHQPTPRLRDTKSNQRSNSSSTCKSPPPCHVMSGNVMPFFRIRRLNSRRY